MVAGLQEHRWSQYTSYSRTTWLTRVCQFAGKHISPRLIQQGNIWRAVCTKNNVDVVKLILGRVVRGRGLVGVTYVGVAYSKWIVVVLLCSCLLVTSHPSVSVRVTVSKSLCICLCVTESGM